MRTLIDLLRGPDAVERILRHDGWKLTATSPKCRVAAPTSRKSISA